jgi:hypothetical protein
MSDEPGVTPTGGEPVPPPAAEPPANPPTNGDDPNNPVPPGSGEPLANSEPPSSQTSGGYDALPQYGKDIIGRQTEAKNAEKARADAAEARIAELEGQPPTGGTPAPVDDDPDGQLALFESLAQKSGYKKPEEVQAMVDQEFARRDQENADIADEKQLEATLTKFDGKELPQVTREELKVYLETIQYDPNLKYLAGAPWDVIASTLKADAIAEMKGNKILEGSDGGPTPPTIAAPAEGGQTPSNGPRRYDNISDLKAGLMANLGL